MKRYYNATTNEYYTEGSCMTRRISPTCIWSGKPTSEQLAEWGYVDVTENIYNETQNEDQLNFQYTPTYEELVEQKIRERYTMSNEFALLRQRFTKPEEFEAYNDYCEECKAAARNELGIEPEATN